MFLASPIFSPSWWAMGKIAEEPHNKELDAIELKDASSSDWSLK